MYNFTPYGQAVRPSYNMLFSHFKQLGYSDELAGTEANRIMLQANAYNQYANAQSQGVQYPNVYQNPGFVPSAIPNYQYPNVYTQQMKTPAQNPNPSLPQPPPASQPLQQNVQQPNVPATAYDKSNLLSGVKLSSRPPIPGLTVPSSSTTNDSQKGGIKINVKQPPEDKAVGKGQGSTTLPPQHTHQQVQPVASTYQVTQQAQANYQMMQAYAAQGYSLNQQVPANYGYPAVGNTYYQKAQYSGVIPKNPSLSKVFYYDTKGRSSNKKTQESNKAPMTIDQVNKWIQDLYIHLNMTTCSKKLRKSVNVYIQHILQKFRSGSLDKSDLRMLTPEEILDFKPKTQPPEPPSDESPPEPEVETPVKVVTTPTNKSKKKSVKTKKTETPTEVVYETKPKLMDQYEKQRREQRSQRFKTKQNIPVYNFNMEKSKKIVGLSQELEKPYLRLTSEPNPLIVRPEKVLIKAFKYVFDKFLDNKNYRYIQEQFRSIRQDIQVQHLRTQFVVNVYTTNARLALLHNDLDQFNQCQTQLKHLLCYFQDCQGVKEEFELYYILYLSLQNMNMGLLRYLKENYVSETESNEPQLKGNTEELSRFQNTRYFKFANDLRVSILDENFIQYFKMADTKNINYDHYLKLIYNQAFNEESDRQKHRNAHNVENEDEKSLFYCKLLFKMFESKFRMFSLYTLCRSSLTMTPNILVELLNFSDEQECNDFLREHNVIFNQSNLIDCKQTLNVIVESPLMRSKKI